MKYYIISGEASGDLHGSNLIRELKELDPEGLFRCWGGDEMANIEQVNVVKHYRDLAFMGFIEVIQNIGTIYNNLEFCKKDIKAFDPDVLLLIDYPGFNLRIAEFAHKAGFKVFYYISPQIWAWKQNRVHKIKKYVDQMFVILPFEKDFYNKFDYNVDFVGHPLLDAIEKFQLRTEEEFKRFYKLNDKPIIAVLPGSRKQEISAMLPTMLKVKKEFPDYQFVIAGAPGMLKTFYTGLVGDSGVNIVEGNTYGLLKHAKAAIVTSGTATLETALFKVPEIVCYKGSSISYLIARNLVKIKYISLVNLIMDREIVKELIQKLFNQKTVTSELNKLLNDENYRNEMLKNYNELSERLGGKGASEQTAKLMIQYLNE